MQAAKLRAIGTPIRNGVQVPSHGLAYPKVGHTLPHIQWNKQGCVL
jgi:hypothetical protein